MYKVLIYQNYKKVRSGMILCEDFENFHDALRSAMENSRIYDFREFVIRKYDESVSNIITFTAQDTGEVKYICFNESKAEKIVDSWYITQGETTFVEPLGKRFCEESVDFGDDLSNEESRSEIIAKRFNQGALQKEDFIYLSEEVEDTEKAMLDYVVKRVWEVA